ncbi:MAG: Nickel-dependent lactate racemase [Candidatus Methanohalarchaeum thermophilum]|uniref:Nickel-dependent lactate racemase n=1 Tax=Methanohalarchaeum thermophilum TaxID=1903181 RepID=A0A1Q6DUB7_METT1|nr:MAG: Nickel-dependent lactate racemase [Candidatus Methanohalarchaeum thermophilum]
MVDEVFEDIEKSLEGLENSDILNSFENLVEAGFSDLKGFVGEESVLFVVNDRNRNTPTSIILKLILDYFDRNNISLTERKVGLIVATGSHDPPTEEEIHEILGSVYDDLRPVLMVHQSGESDHFFVGSTSFGTRIEVDKQILGYDKIICINSIEPHYFAGFTGGRKSLVPGVISWKTIEDNHENALKEEARALSLSDNPVHLDMVEATKKIIAEVDSDFIGINMVTDGDKIYDIKLGDIFESFNKLVEKSREVFTVSLKDKRDIVIARVGEPFNRNLYQSLKGFENGKLICRDGGIVILVSECYEGIGPSEFFDRLSNSKDPEKIINEISENYVLGSHKAFNILKFLENHELFLVSDLEDELVEKCFINSFNSVKEALNIAKNEFKTKPSVIELKDSINQVPSLKQNTAKS